jgi:3-dehydroquinate dehydratase
MISEMVEAHQLVKTINTTTHHIEKLVIIAKSSTHTLTAMLYAIILLVLVVLDIVVAKEMFKE